ncbi:protein rtoA-like isoform X5 [Ischnura elegans]|uniref:protein rtoA-like isoform X5 n=1 Tax=Ischnura elegans TaxID=197161 RepID=UPI001ED86712|nr:protein rtoA-like isoform X5 [Ischnura elegans]
MPVPKAKTAAAEKGVAAKAEAPVPENPAKPKWMQYRKAKPEAAQTTDEEAEEWSDDNGSDGSCLESEGTTSSSESDSDSGESEGSSSGTSDSESSSSSNSELNSSWSSSGSSDSENSKCRNSSAK